MTDARLPFIDWMKCLGMLVIVYGHSGGRSIPHLTDPFNPKQLGVVGFVFVMGYSLARESRPVGRVMYNRMFEIGLFGLTIAMLLSAIQWWRIADLNESNYLPFFLGANVLFDNFPTNPTTWYIGAYLHLLLMWAVAWRRITVQAWHVALAALLEIPVRAVVFRWCGPFVAYQLLTNWTAIFLFGMYVGRRLDPHAPPRWRSTVVTLILTAFVLLWPVLGKSCGFDPEGFPWMLPRDTGVWQGLLMTSSCISLLYLSYAWLAYELTRRLPESARIQFFARNTVVVFIAHMPLIFTLSPYVYPWVPPGAIRVVVNLLIYYVLLSLLSDVVRRLVQPPRLREAIYSFFARRRLNL